MKKHGISFKHAFNGLLVAFKEQPNLKIHLSFAVLVIALGYFLPVSYLEWMILIFSISLVLIAEMMNTTVEAVTDLLTEKWHLKAEIAKDVGAGMVLLSAFFASIVGLIIFVPKIVQVLK
ncbi:diacylglycerol kinase family protein [Patescibacteria group bacterium]|nr:diacylglycerol kinase family protein [Patescibacteria group bacterium]MBU1931754.1 diacylglycerol kinase family protein [Patescibacteria group bacterium]